MTYQFNWKAFYTYLKVGIVFLTLGYIWTLTQLRMFTNHPVVQIMPKSEQPFRTYTPPKILNKPEYKVFLLGDSMTLALGPHGGIFNGTINKLYEKNHKFVDIYNYARASTNVLSLDDAISIEARVFDYTFDPLLSRDFDLLLIESFGYNPLSQYPREEGLQRQRLELNKIMKTLITAHPNSAIIFFTTIAPNKQNYARTTLRSLSPADRAVQAEERIAFMQNHVAYANAHNIPVINIFEKSLKDGDGNLAYINPDDYIHPSTVGINLISDELAKYIYDNEILPR